MQGNFARKDREKGRKEERPTYKKGETTADKLVY
jgi:hypothetical protein